MVRRLLGSLLIILGLGLMVVGVSTPVLAGVGATVSVTFRVRPFQHLTVTGEPAVAGGPVADGGAAGPTTSPSPSPGAGGAVTLSVMSTVEYTLWRTVAAVGSEAAPRIQSAALTNPLGQTYILPAGSLLLDESVVLPERFILIYHVAPR
ncbi:MAG: hypothetical protein AB1645_07070 [Bacillota bacterium]